LMLVNQRLSPACLNPLKHMLQRKESLSRWMAPLM